MPTIMLRSTPRTLQARRLVGALLATLVGVSMGVSAVGAAEIKVLTTGAFKPVAAEMASKFEAATGTKVTVENDTAGALTRKIEAGAAFDVVILTPGALAAFVRDGKVAPPVMELARVAIGVAVKEGAPQPDISSVDAFKRTLLAANKVAMIDPASGGSSGIYLEKLFERMGIADEMKRKAVLVPGGLVATRVVSGEADIAIHQISEILAVKGAVLVGPLPREIQNETIYAGALSNTTREDAAGRFLKLLAGPEAGPVLEAKGMLPPAR